MNETSREITDLEGQLLSMRNLLSIQGNLVHALAEQERIDSLWVANPRLEDWSFDQLLQALKQLGDGPRAHTLLLQYHLKKLQASMRSIRSSNNSLGGGGGSYATVISQFVFSTIARAMSDSMSVFGEESSYTSELVSWAVKQTESFALLLKRHVLASSAATGGLRVSADLGSQPKLSSSANKLNSMVQEFLEDIVPLECLHLDGPALEGVQRAFNSYVDLLIQALPGSTDTEENLEGSGRVVQPAETEMKQLALLANASLLADELLPRAATKLLSSNNRMDEQSRKGSEKPSHLPEQREWKRKLQQSVDRLRDSFCRLQALELIFTDDGDTNLNAHTYTSMDDHTEEPEWFPSPIFQLVFTKITNLASTATDVFVGRERFATVLLMRLMETIILWLSDDQAFWEEIEQGAKPLGPFGQK
ncbi:Exocyst complex component EXO84A [Linum perenne]